MATSLNPYVLSAPNSKIRTVFNKVDGKEGLVKFVLGEPNFDTAPNIIAAAEKALEAGHTHYVANAGIFELRKAISDKMQRDNHIYYDPQTEIMVANGGTEAIWLSMQAIIEPGDEVLVPGPYWSPYPSLVKLLHAVPVVVPMLEEDGFMYNIENLRKAVTPRTKLLILNTPCNPTGGMADLQLLKEIAALAKERDFYVMSDEVYEKLVYDGNEHVSLASLPGMKERTITVNSFSKSYAMTGWRVGYVMSDAKIIKYCNKLHELEASCTNVPAQWGAVEALTGDQAVVDFMLGEYTRRRRMIVDGLNAIKGISCVAPKGTFYAFANMKGANMCSDEFCNRLIDEAGLVVIPGDAFGEYGEGYVRMSFAVSDETIIEGLNRLDMFMSKLSI
ncbi:pyridoxal phosphate-dependent aminotransferase [Qiania dongpingensis]|uniref:Aminotransferase n=1 Tax=Qiania dongpingensis TaxID=2763669 RepID=A0A7G9G1A7_9FIRM|nr:pyridoxal phosphate-dependent aminotransferase [Qiania dongpingensis]QNM04589.1 pyridoxal phosphate-dependent aminotransferase [Qiania dongpingensis]